jgi:hypothetical protein
MMKTTVANRVGGGAAQEIHQYGYQVSGLLAYLSGIFTWETFVTPETQIRDTRKGNHL